MGNVEGKAVSSRSTAIVRSPFSTVNRTSSVVSMTTRVWSGATQWRMFMIWFIARAQDGQTDPKIHDGQNHEEL